MRITRPRATAFTQLTGVASAAQMATNVEAAINGKFTTHNFEIEKTIPQLDLDCTHANGELWRLESTYGGGANTGAYVIKDEAGNTWLSFTQGGGAPVISLSPGGGASKDIGAMEPSGIITLWSGAISAIPTGWVLCDGNNSTPNLTDRFVIHADADAAGTRNVGDTGGAMTHTLTTAELSSHGHLQKVANAVGGGVAALPDVIGTRSGVINADALATSNNAGSGNAHAILNKFHALAYIMKT